MPCRQPKTKAESKYFATAAAMDAAFLDLLSKKDFAYITVKEICAAAGVNRSTFYLHYETVADLLNESVDYINAQFLAHMATDSESFIGRLRDCPTEELYLVTPQYLRPYLGFIAENRRLFRTVLDHADTLHLDACYAGLFSHVLSPILTRFSVPQAEHRYRMAFYMQGMMAIVKLWVEGGCADPIEDIIAVMQHCVAKPTAPRPPKAPA